MPCKISKEEEGGAGLAGTAVVRRLSRIEMQQDFEQKNSLLGSYHQRVAPVDYYSRMFQADYGKTRVCMLSEAADGHKFRKFHDGMDEALDMAASRSDMYVYPCSFFNDYVNTATLERLYAFTMDLDHICIADIKMLEASHWFGLTPTYVVNSGSGLHVVYMLSIPVECYHWTIPLLNQIYKKLKNRFYRPEDGYEVDYGTSLIQSYRLVGGLTKAGNIAAAYRVGQVWGIEQMAAVTGVAWKRPGEDTVRQPRVRKDRDNIGMLPSGRRGFYTSTLARVREETPEGNRYMAMFALAVIAYKCRVPVSELERDLYSLLDTFNDRAISSVVRDREIQKAIKGYNRKAKFAKADKLEEWLGFAFARKTKRNYQSRDAHLQLARKSRNDKQRAQKIGQLLAYLNDHPQASNTELSEMLAMSRSTICKYRQVAEEALEAEAHQEQLQAQWPKAQTVEEVPISFAKTGDWFEILPADPRLPALPNSGCTLLLRLLPP